MAPPTPSLGTSPSLVLAGTLAVLAPALSAHDAAAPSSGAPVLVEPDPTAEHPPSRALLLELCREPRLAGTAGSERAAHWVAAELRELGWRVELETREVLLSFPEAIELAAHLSDEDGGRFGPELFTRRDRFDPDARPTGDVPLYHSWSGDAKIAGELVDCGRGLRADFERLVAAGVELENRVALCRYGGAYRGVKAALAAEYGCNGVLMYDHGDDNGPGRGATWPAGPWKPPHDGQRGSILSLTEAPGDPSTPGWPSPLLEGTPGSDEQPDRAPLSGAELQERLPRIPSMPIGWAHAEQLLEQLEAGVEVTVALDIDMRVERRPVTNVIASFGPEGGDFVLAGTHRDAWVRGAQDSGSGIVSLLRAAAHLSERAAAGWQPASGIKLAFWDAEETGLIGSTEWGEAHATTLQQHLLAYVNGDACVSGLRLRAGGTPGLQGVLERALAKVPSPIPRQTEAFHEPSLLDDWVGAAQAMDPEDEDARPHLGLPGSGSDYTVFLHHLGLPVLDLGLGGNGGGQYHTAADDFGIVDRYLDPGFAGHETAGRMFAEVLATIADEGRASFDAAQAARELRSILGSLELAALPGVTQDAGELRQARGDLVSALEDYAAAVDAGEVPGGGAHFYRDLAVEGGLPGSPWYRNPFWTPGAETGYAAVLLPYLHDTYRYAGGRISDLIGRHGIARGLDPEEAYSGSNFDDLPRQLDPEEGRAPGRTGGL